MEQLLIYNWATILKEVKIHDTKTMIHKLTGITYSHISEYMNIFIDKGLVKSERIGRREIVKLTPKGLKVLEALNKLEELIK